MAVDDTGSMPQDSTATFDVLANDSDPEGDALTLTISSPPAAGTATVVNGEIQFVPAAGSTATGVIGYTITDVNGGTDSATLTVTVTEVITNEPPVAEDDTGSMPQDSTATFDVLSNDSDPEGDALTLTISSPPAAGTATVVTGGIEFTPAAGSTETGVIGYTITDVNGGEATATLTVTVTEVITCLLYTSPSPRDKRQSRMPSSA